MPNLQDKSDRELFHLMVLDDEAAFNEIYDRYWKVLCYAAYKRVKSTVTAEEIVQEVFISLYARRYEIQLEVSLLAYLKRAVQYKVYNVYRDMLMRERFLEQKAYEPEKQPMQPDHLLQRKELRQSIDDVTNTLPDKCRDVFVMSRLEELSHKEIADKLHIAISTVKKHLTKALTTLRREFSNKHLDI
ncbi:RNA polymerase sigma-70 factor [Olivibacter ginsenosidimutans]|uniref:RNA polymerase sigma-70 factor n=1 Tax=Olivibacter ginsenosidimutans TaxID=1176537 RepID=A0ABP9BK69_9SPHI